MNIGSTSQPTDFALDVLGRYVCNTFDEALANSDAPYRSNAIDLKGNPLSPRGDMRPFDFIVIGGGTFGGAVAEQLFYRSTGRSERILVLEGGPFLLPEHWQNLPSMSLGGEVWGVPWNSNTNDFQGLAFCIGGRSIFWGGWSPRLLDSETVTWPQAVLDDLNAKKLANGDSGCFRQSGQQIGVTETNDYIFGDLHTALRDVLFDAIESGKVSEAMKLSSLPEAPPVEILDTPPALADLAAMLGIPLPNPLPADTAKLEKDLRNKIIALGTIESTRLALLSFGEDGRIGANLIAHLRSNIDFRIPRGALAALPPGLKALQSSALLLKGQHQFKKPDGTPDGVGHFHFQITATGLDNVNANSEAELFQKIPDVDTVLQHLNATDSQVVITIRGIGEMEPRNPASNVTRDLNPAQTDFNERKAYVNLNASARDLELWDAMDKASDDLAHVFGGGLEFEVFTPQGIKKAKPASGGQLRMDLKTLLFYTAKNDPNPANRGRRDGLGTTHHEAGTLRMGDNPSDSVTDANCRFHSVTNTYVAGPALFPSAGSPNPMLTGIALARRLGDHLLPAAPP